jgi:hypothetical protein
MFGALDLAGSFARLAVVLRAGAGDVANAKPPLSFSANARVRVWRGAASAPRGSCPRSFSNARCVARTCSCELSRNAARLQLRELSRNAARTCSCASSLEAPQALRLTGPWARRGRCHRRRPGGAQRRHRTRSDIPFRRSHQLQALPPPAAGFGVSARRLASALVRREKKRQQNKHFTRRNLLHREAASPLGRCSCKILLVSSSNGFAGFGYNPNSS